MDKALTSEYVFQDTVDTDYPKYIYDKSDDVILNKKFDSIISGKTAYLNIPFFIIRSIIYVFEMVFIAFFV